MSNVLGARRSAVSIADSGSSRQQRTLSIGQALLAAACIALCVPAFSESLLRLGGTAVDPDHKAGAKAYIEMTEDANGQGSGWTAFTRSYTENKEITLTAPETLNGYSFRQWRIGPKMEEPRKRTVTFRLSKNNGFNSFGLVCAFYGDATATAPTGNINIYDPNTGEVTHSGPDGQLIREPANGTQNIPTSQSNTKPAVQSKARPKARPMSPEAAALAEKYARVTNARAANSQATSDTKAQDKKPDSTSGQASAQKKDSPQKPPLTQYQRNLGRLLKDRPGMYQQRTGRTLGE